MGLQLAGALYAFWRVSNQDREGRSWCEQVLAQPGAQARTAARAKALYAAGITTFFQGDPPEAHRWLEECIAIGREIGAVFKRYLALALAMLGHVKLLQGDPTIACELAEEGVRLCREVGEAWWTALALFILGYATVELGDPGTARSFLEESAALFRMIRDKQRLALPLNALGLVALHEGDASAARAHCEEALAVAQETGNVHYSADSLTHLGTVALRVGDYQQAAALYQQSLALISTRGHRVKIAEDLAGLADVANLVGQPERAAQLFGAVEVMHEVARIRLSPLRRAEYDRTVESIRTHLDEAAFAAAWKKGRTMTQEQVIAYALETKDAFPTEASSPEVNTEEVSSSGALSSLPPPPLSSRRALKQHFGGLTVREREVACLVAQGQSNRVIAEKLVVGISTVEAHISHIFTKLGFSSRAQIAAWAIEKGLVQVQQDEEVKRPGARTTS
jgi:ATP/maltotriose-dependent transcriptional regulator MalT